MRKDIEFENSGEIRDFKEYDENKLAVAKVCVLSTAPNSHQLNISEEVLRRDIGSIRGNFLVAHMLLGDATTHTASEVPVGYFLPNEPIEFEEVETDNGKIVKAWAYAVLSKQYAKSAYDMFVADNHRATSIEMTITTSEEDEHEVISFDAYGSTILGKTVKPSCKDAEISLVRFAEEANSFYDEYKERLADVEGLVKQTEKLAESKYTNHPISKSKNDIYEGEWDGQKVKEDLIKEKNFKSLVPKVCMKLEEGWEDREITKLGYPVMTLHEGKWVYSRRGLASALSYAKKENEATVVSKIEKIYKDLGLEEKERKEETKMEIEFAAVNIGDLWSTLYNAMRDARHWDYYIQGIYEEDNQKFAIIYDDTKKLYRLDFSLTEEGITLANEITEVVQEFVVTDNIQRFAEPENVADYQFAEPETKEDEPEKPVESTKDEEEKSVEMSVDECMEKIAKLEADVEERDNIIMTKDTELEELRAFKKGVEDKEKAVSIETVLSEIKGCIDEVKMAELRSEGMTYEFANLDVWSNKVKAMAFEATKPVDENNDGIFRCAAPVSEQKKSTNVWERIKNSI